MEVAEMYGNRVKLVLAVLAFPPPYPIIIMIVIGAMTLIMIMTD